MVSEQDVSAAIGSTVYGSDGRSVGTVDSFYSDDLTGVPTWVSVSSGLLGTRRAIAPADDATFADGRLQLTVPAGAVSDAPRLGGEHLAPEDEEELRRHYAQARRSAGEGPAESEDRHVDGRADDRADGGADGAMVRSEEQLRVRTESVAQRRVRVVRYVVTEEVQVTVPVRREEIRIEELPLDADPEDDGVDGESLVDGARTAAVGSGLPDEIVLHAERPVVTVEVVPVERVRLRTELVTGQESVSGTVQREQVAVDHDRSPDGR
ncbi:PRC-barrel domain-containing protein [Candidatus Blastococcus massiliensis]|uniref:PRC-barrel domain-containing protein n=1 Tax=Candidatus Blastococcus massiliensis TaxID=1470358 RepID=UPI0004B9CB02|nr:PRC-barrel domain-containing protein [Candidatus Blastococcus massiliensis]